MEKRERRIEKSLKILKKRESKREIAVNEWEE